MSLCSELGPEGTEKLEGNVTWNFFPQLSGTQNLLLQTSALTYYLPIYGGFEWHLRELRYCSKPLQEHHKSSTAAAIPFSIISTGYTSVFVRALDLCTMCVSAYLIWTCMVEAY